MAFLNGLKKIISEEATKWGDGDFTIGDKASKSTSPVLKLRQLVTVAGTSKGMRKQSGEQKLLISQQSLSKTEFRRRWQTFFAKKGYCDSEHKCFQS